MSSIVSFVATNPATSTGGNTTALMYDNVAATLTLTLTNLTGADVTLPASESCLTIICPRCFTVADLQAATLTPPAGLNASFDGLVSFNVSVGSSDYVWANNAALTFTLSSLQTAGPDSTYFFVARFSASGSVLPAQVTANLAVQAAPVNENANLSSVLDITFQPNGTDAVYVSTIEPYLINELWFNFNNDGSQPIFNGTTNPGNPQVIVSFTYGSDPGSLAPMSVASQFGLNVSSEEGNAWSVQSNSENDAQIWTLTPGATDIIGTGSSANVTFSLANLIAPTAGGNVTQMVLQFLGFWQSDTVAYNPWLVFMNIDKLVTPVGRGLVNFQSATITTSVASPTDTASIDFNWTMNFVAQVQLSYALGQTRVTAATINYIQQTSGASDSVTISVAGIKSDTMVVFTLTSFDENSNALNAIQFSVFIQADYFLDPRDDQVYPATQIGGLLWMVESLAWASPGSLPVNGDNSNTPTCGLLYSFSDACSVPVTPDDWRLASEDDYQTFDTLQLTFSELMGSGPGMPNIQLAGLWNLNGYESFGWMGVYWTNTPCPGNYPQAMIYNLMYTGSASFYTFPTTDTPTGSLFYCSVRFVRDILTSAQIAALREKSLEH